MSITAMVSQRLVAARRIRFLKNEHSEQLDEVSQHMLGRWCRASVRIRIELVKRNHIRAVRHWLLSSAEIRQLFGLRNSQASIRRIMTTVCDDVRASGVALVALVEIDDELVITFAAQ